MSISRIASQNAGSISRCRGLARGNPGTGGSLRNGITLRIHLRKAWIGDELGTRVTVCEGAASIASYARFKERWRVSGLRDAVAAVVAAIRRFCSSAMSVSRIRIPSQARTVTSSVSLNAHQSQLSPFHSPDSRQTGFTFATLHTP